jgi:putative PIN family toxin of toxin-antitoxin system
VKVVLDSNIYISAFAFDRDPEKIIEFGIAMKFRVYSSMYIIEEVKRILGEKLGAGERFVVLAGKRIEKYSTVVPVRGSARTEVVPVDPKDGPIVKTCLAWRADFLVTGDKRLFPLSIRGVEIVGVSGFLRHLRTGGIL